MATLTRGEIFAAEGAPAVVTGHAGKRARRGVMIQGLRSRDLSGLRHPGPNVVAVVTAQAFVRPVLRVTEVDRVGCGHLRRAHARTQIMTSAARGDVVAGLILGTRAMTLVAGRMCHESRWN